MTDKIELVEWEDRPHCLYLNDRRIAGGKPWGGGTVIRTWKVDRKTILEALELDDIAEAKRRKA